MNHAIEISCILVTDNKLYQVFDNFYILENADSVKEDFLAALPDKFLDFLKAYIFQLHQQMNFHLLQSTWGERMS